MQKIIAAFALLAAAVLLFMVSNAAPVQAEERLGDHGYLHASGHLSGGENYEDWMQPDSPEIGCCSNEDCRPTKAEYRNGEWWVILDGEWVQVPKNKILDGTSTTELAHVCAPVYVPPEQRDSSADSYGAYSEKGTIYCFMRPGGQS